MEMTPVTSSQISAVGFDSNEAASADAPTVTLAIQFKGASAGDLYHYFDVPRQIALDLAAAESPGSYFYKNIKAKFRYQRIMPTQPADAGPAAA